MKSSSLRRFAAGLLFTVVAASFLMALPVRQKAASGYHLIKTVSLPPAPGGDEYYDYLTVDADARRLYVSHGTEVVVLNADNYSVVGKIGGLTRSHGIAIARDLGKGFISDGDSRPGGTVQQVVFFDLKTLKTTGKVPTGQFDTDAIIYEPVTKHVFTFNGDSHNSTVIDAERQAVVTTIDLVGKVEFPAVDGKGMVYDNNPEKNDVVAIDPGTGMLFVSTREGMLHIFREDSPDKLSEVETVKTEYGAKTCQVDTKTHNVFLSTSDFNPPAAPTERQPRPLPTPKPGNFRVLVYGR